MHIPDRVKTVIAVAFTLFVVATAALGLMLPSLHIPDQTKAIMMGVAAAFVFIPIWVAAPLIPDHSAPGVCACGESIPLDEPECIECWSIRLSAP